MDLRTSRCLVDATGAVLAAEDADQVFPTASVGKVFLLCEAAERIVAGRLDPRLPIARDPEVAVADSGLWQHLAQATLPLGDLCVLVAAVSDNWATNALLGLIGLPAVAERAQSLGCAHSGLHDRVRDHRGAGDPPTLSTGTARELAEVARRIHVAAGGAEGLGLSPAAAFLVERWLQTGVDLSLVAAPLGLDPLAHVDAALMLWNKTGWDAGVRAEMGAAWTKGTAPHTGVFYAALTRWSGEAAGAGRAVAYLRDTGHRIADQLNVGRQGLEP